jgi:hypothetical protein
LAFVVIVAFPSLAVGQVKQQKYPELKGSRDDSNGSIEWISRGEEGDSVWTYSYAVKNLGKLNCRTNWDAVKLASVIFPGDSATGSVTGPIELRQVNGVLKYNGGTAAGEGSAEAPAWVANDRKPTKCTADASLVVDSGTQLFPIDVRATSSIALDEKSKNYVLSYELTVAPAKRKVDEPRGDKISRDMAHFKSTVVMVWESIAAPVWEREGAAKYQFGQVKKSGEMLLQKEPAEDGGLKLVGTLQTGSRDVPVLVSKPLVFSVYGNDGTATVTASAILPAYAPASKDE